MKSIIIFSALFFISLNSNAQTIKSNYTIVKVSKLWDIGFFGKLDSLVDFNSIDTVNISNNNSSLLVLVGDLEIKSNDSICILKMVVRKSNAPKMIAKGHTMVCLIDYKNKLIYDNSNNSILPYYVPSLKTALKDETYKVVSLHKDDSISDIIYKFDLNYIQIKTKKSIPKNVRATMLDIENSYGISTFRTKNQFIKLQNYSILKEGISNREIKKIKSRCKKTVEMKKLLYL